MSSALDEREEESSGNSRTWAGSNGAFYERGSSLARATLVRTLLVSIFAGALFGQNQTNGTSPPSPIATDRPAFTASSIVVPRGSLQFENGFLETTAEGQQGFDFPETLVRFGVAS